MTPDPEEAEYALWIGGFPGGSGLNFQSAGKRTIGNLVSGKLKIDVVDCTLANGAVTPTIPNISWTPIKPATNGAFNAALIRWILDNKTYNADALAFTTQKAAVEGGLASYTNATYLVIDDEKHPHNRKLMRAADAGIASPEKKDKDGTQAEHYVVIDLESGQPMVHSSCGKGTLEFDGKVNGVHVRTGFSILGDAVRAHTMDEYAEITGVPVNELERMAREYTSHGPKASIWARGGSSAAVNGLDAAMGSATLCALIGSNQMTGGNVPEQMSPVTMGNGTRYSLGSIKGKPEISSKNAVYLARTGRSWTQTAEYQRRIAQGERDPKPMLPWFPFAPASDSQALMSLVNGYPYKAKILTSWMCNTIQATPGAMREEVISRLKDPAVLPLHIACDVVIGEHAQLADYIVPDLNTYESFGLPTVGSSYAGYGSTVRWQVKEPESMLLDDGRHASWEAFVADVAAACELPGWGDNAIPDADGRRWPLRDASDFYLKAIANLAYAEQPVADIAQGDVHAQALDQLPESFKAAVSEEEWPKVLNVLSRGGRYWPLSYVKGSDGRSRWYEDSFETWLYSEKRAASKNNYSAGSLPGTAGYSPQLFANLSPMSDVYDLDEYAFTASEHKPRFRSVSMLSNSPIMRDLCDHNYVEMNRDDAKSLGISDGDLVRAITPRGDVTSGEAMVRAGQVRGAFSTSFGYGHDNYGAQDIEIDGSMEQGNPAIGTGTRVQTMLDPTVSVGDVLSIIADNDAACPGRSGGMFKIEKA